MQIRNSKLCESSKCRVCSAVYHPWWISMLIHRRVLLWLVLAVRYIWWQRWDDDNCQNGVALPMKSPGQDSRRVFSEGEVMGRDSLPWKNMLVQRISGILSACNMQIRNSKLCESSKRSKPHLVDEHAFPPTGFAVAWPGCSLQKYLPIGQTCSYFFLLNLLKCKL